MIELYDNAASVAAQKVRLVLDEKGIEWTRVAVDLRNGEVMRPAYLALNPQGVVPTLVHDGEVIVESSLIVEYLDDLVPEPPLRPAAPLARARMRAWLRRIDDEVQRAIGNLSMAVYIRDAHLARPRDERDAHFARMPDRDRAQRQQDAIEHGTAAPQFAPAIRTLARMVDDVDAALGDRDWLAGDRFSLADVAVAPYATRMQMVGLDALWLGGRRPRMHAWWRRLAARPSWQRQVRDAYPPAARDTMAARGRDAWPVVAEILGLPAAPVHGD